MRHRQHALAWHVASAQHVFQERHHIVHTLGTAKRDDQNRTVGRRWLGWRADVRGSVLCHNLPADRFGWLRADIDHAIAYLDPIGGHSSAGDAIHDLTRLQIVLGEVPGTGDDTHAVAD